MNSKVSVSFDCVGTLGWSENDIIVLQLPQLDGHITKYFIFDLLIV